MGSVHYGVLLANVLQLLNLRSRLQCQLRDCVVSSPGAVVMHIHRVVDDDSAIVWILDDQVPVAEKPPIVSSKENGPPSAFNESFHKFAAIRCRKAGDGIQNTETTESITADRYIVGACAQPCTIGSFIRAIGLALVATIINDSAPHPSPPVMLKPFVTHGFENPSSI